MVHRKEVAPSGSASAFAIVAEPASAAFPLCGRRHLPYSGCRCPARRMGHPTTGTSRSAGIDPPVAARQRGVSPAAALFLLAHPARPRTGQGRARQSQFQQREQTLPVEHATAPHTCRDAATLDQLAATSNLDVWWMTAVVVFDRRLYFLSIASSALGRGDRVSAASPC
jgi:hypothetical protein